MFRNKTKEICEIWLGCMGGRKRGDTVEEKRQAGETPPHEAAPGK
jgi:hypothetical protein